MKAVPAWTKRELPDAPPWRTLIGPSLILLGLGLGSGEVILWPYLAANWGLGIIWAALLGITIQFFLNMEVERYALVRGESVFVGFYRLLRWLPFWFILSTLTGWIWPGIAATAAQLFARAFGLSSHIPLTIGLLLLIGIILSAGAVLYRTMERYQKVAIGFGIPFIILMVLLVTNGSDWQALWRGFAGQGSGFRGIPPDIQLFTFLGALAYAGAGGNLNLAQSFYVKEKGFGMGAYGGRITNALLGKKERVQLHGATFAETPENLGRFRRWWRAVNTEHAVVFWFLGLLTISLLALLSYSTTYGSGATVAGIQFILTESVMIGQRTLTWVGPVFLVVMGLMLFGTQLTVIDSTSRILTENFVLISDRLRNRIPTVYYSVLWLQIFFGVTVLLLGFSEPKNLVVIGSVFNALAMFVSFALILALNRRLLPRAVRPSWWRQLIIIGSFLFFGYFSWQAISTALGL